MMDAEFHDIRTDPHAYIAGARRAATVAACALVGALIFIAGLLIGQNL